MPGPSITSPPAPELRESTRYAALNNQIAHACSPDAYRAPDAYSCLSVWCLQHEPGPDARAVRGVLVRLSGRQMKHGVEHTAPALLAGLDKLLAVLDLMRTRDRDALVAQAQRVLPMLFDST